MVAWVDLGGAVWVISVFCITFPSVPVLVVLLKLAALCASMFYHSTGATSCWKHMATTMDFLLIPLWGVAQLLLFGQGDAAYLFSVSLFFGVFCVLNTALVAWGWNETRHYSLAAYFIVCILWIGARAVVMTGFGLLPCFLYLSSALLYSCAWCVSPIMSPHHPIPPWHTDKWTFHCDFHVLLYAADTVLTFLSVHAP